MNQPWSEQMPAVQFRVARPTHQLDKIIEFYTKGLGLEIVGSFAKHEGYDGVMFGLPGVDYHLEFTQHVDALPVLPLLKTIYWSSISRMETPEMISSHD